MAGYFEEMGWTPLAEGEAPEHYLHFARLLRDFNMFDELGVPNNLPPPASKDVVNNLPDIQINTSDQKCPVCLKEYDMNEKAKQLPCKHIFHPECILPWLQKTNSCPLCRHELPTDDETYELYKKEQIRAKQRQNDIESLHNSMFS